ncbi:MAG: 4-hydroxy-tetrahydrodipicolinate synthase [Alphaproteobacteria bacterium]|nr:4-hydroxy-tetrahydrodipicolinate synthase [Alphaproteobacteria bacterium]
MTTLEGTWTALATPFKNGAVDEAKIRELTKWQIKNGVNGIIACGTTGEAPTLSEEEHSAVVRNIVEAAEKKVPVYAGVGTNNTKHVIENAKRVEKEGANGLLVVSPYYNKPTQKGLYEHFRAVAEATPLPIIVYNIQGRTAVNVETATLAKLSEDCKNIVGVKEASGSLDQMSQVMRMCRKGFAMLSGDDGLTLPCMAVGGTGVISTSSNVVPKEMSEMTSAALAGDFAKAREIHFKLYPLFKVLFIESNPQPLKEAMAMMKLINAPELRLPMVRMEEANRQKLAAALKDYGLI